MALVTGTPQGNVDSKESLWLEGAPSFWVQNYLADPLWNPDAQGYYWGLSGTTSYPAYGIGCVTDVSFGQGITANDIRCDGDGVQGHIQRRDYVEFTFTMQEFLPLSTYVQLANFSDADVGTGYEVAGMGEVDNNKYWMVYAIRVYDQNTGDWLVIHLHKAQFVEPGEIQFRYGQPWIQTFKVRGFADPDKPSTQRFGVIRRADPSALP